MRWRISLAVVALLVAAAAGSHWWALGDYRSMGLALLVGAGIFAVLVGAGKGRPGRRT